jgi:hypothetical protein
MRSAMATRRPWGRAPRRRPRPWAGSARRRRRPPRRARRRAARGRRPISPCSSGNSPTVSVTRSAFASTAARARARRPARRPSPEQRRELREATGLVAVAPELRVEDHAVEVGDAVAERVLAVLLDEEGRVGEARAHHALVAAADGVGVERRVHHRQEHRQQPPVARRPSPPVGRSTAKYRWWSRITLSMSASGSFRKFSSKRPATTKASSTRPVTSRSRKASSRSVPPLLRGRVERRHHARAPRVGVDLHVRRREGLDVASAPGRSKRRARGSGGRGSAPRGDAREGEGDHRVAEERDDPLDGAAEGHLAVGPAHALGEGDAPAHGPEHLGRRRALAAAPGVRFTARR